jgi:hypothetical protein
MNNKVTIFLGEQELDVFQDEEISINLSVQNIQDISKVFTDFTQGFSVPASPRNNTIFEHYYRTDIVGGADFRVRPEGRIEINGLVFRYGVIELEGVQMQKNAPYAYDITFYGQLVNLTDLFGEDYLYDLDLSAYNHDYDQATIHSGLTGRGIHSGVIIYPMITAQDVWFYNSQGGNHDPNNIHFHNVNESHGVQYYDLKPAIQLNRVVDAISAKYGISLNIAGVNDYDALYMWCHRRAGYMYKDLTYAMPFEKIEAPDSFGAISPDWWDYGTSTFTPQGATGSGNVYRFDLDISTTYTSDYTIGLFVNGLLIAQSVKNGSFSGFVFENISITNGESVYLAFQASTNEPVTFDTNLIEVSLQFSPNTVYASAYNSAPQSVSATVYVSDLMPEQKVTDFLASLCKMFNLVIIPTSETTFDLLPLGDWYAAGTDVNLSQYFDITESQVEKPQLYKQINFKYNETGAITGEEYRLTNNVGYGDLRSNFVFDTDEELAIEPQFDQMLFGLMQDENNGLTNILAGYAVTRELETYLGQPFLFYAPETYFVGDYPISFIDESNAITGNDSVEVDTIWYCNASSKVTNGATTYSLNYGADIDPYLLESVNNSLYNTYWRDYVVDLYNPSRRLVRVSAILPLGKILNFDLKNKVIWNGQRWIVNTATFALTTGKAEFELLNDV